MIDEPAIDGRRYEQLKNELMRRADVLLSNDGRALPVGTVAAALFDAVARIGEEVTRRLDKVPEKQVANFLTEARIGRDPARPAELPVAFVLAEGVAAGKALTGTRLMTGGDEAVILETRGEVTLIGGGIIAIRGVDADADSVTLPPGAFTSLEPKPPEVARELKSGAGAGAAKLQLSPDAGLEAGMILRLGSAADAPQHRITAVEGDLITIDPALEQSVPDGLAVTAVSGFAPFAAGTRNLQTHVLYLGHETLFDLPSALSLRITGLQLPEATRWEWWGTTEKEKKPDWHRFDRKNVGGALQLTKLKGKTEMLEVHGQTKFWLRATLDGKSETLAIGTDIRVAVAVNGLCSDNPGEICKGAANDEALNVDFEAIAVTTPVVPNKGFYPFGREPRLFDTFYIGSAEALSKPGAKVTMCFDLGGPEFGSLAGFATSDKKIQVFGIGTDRLVYRLRVEPDVGRAETEVFGRLETLPPPPEASGPIREQGSLAVAEANGLVHLVAAGTGGVHFTTFELNAPATVDKVKWQRRAGTEADILKPVDSVAFRRGEGSTLDILGLTGKYLRIWKSEVDKVETHPKLVDNLLVVNDGAVVIIQEAEKVKKTEQNQEEEIWINFIYVSTASKNYWTKILNTDLPPLDRAAWVSEDSSRLFIAGRRQKEVKKDNLAVIGIPLFQNTSKSQERIEELPGISAVEPPAAILKVLLENDLSENSPIAFRAPEAGALPLPALSFATADPTQLQWLTYEQSSASATYAWTEDPVSIGFSSNGNRTFKEIGGIAFVQREDFGISYRSTSDRSWQFIRAKGEAVDLVEGVPKGAKYIVFDGADSGNGFSVRQKNGEIARIEPFARKSGPTPAASGTGFYYAEALDGTAEYFSPQVVTLPEITHSGTGSPRDPPILVAFQSIDSHEATAAEGIWLLEPASSGANNWKNSKALPTKPADGKLIYALLTPASNSDPIESIEAVVLDDPGIINGRPVWPAKSRKSPAIRVLTLGDKKAIVFPHDLLDGDIALLRGASGDWVQIGPSQPANPTLSWEYWNGRAWWALDNLVDGTANLLLSDSVRFTVPSDLAATEVGGKKNHWLRARLIGGEYGQARVTVTTTEIGTDKKTTEQTIDRDLTAIRAPYVARFRIGYCAPNFVLPEVILTEDSLGVRDQTSANVEGQRVEIFAPIADLMNPHPIPTADNAQDDAECCDPCAAGKATAPVAQEAPASGEPFTRGLLIGLARLPKPERLTLYADVVPNGQIRELKAEVLHKGAFKSLQVDDNTYGLSEPGIISFPVPFAVDQVDVTGQSAYWLRLRPKSGGAEWSPNLRGLYLNAAVARSVETRDISGLGASSGIPDQELTLAQPPIEVKSLDLRVRERPSDAEREALQRDGDADVILEAIGEMPGPWVRWREVDDLGAWESTDRAYMLDTETGTVRFGDGVHGMIPPLGADILAKRYRRVVGAKANGTEAGAELQLISPIAGVEKVVALDRAAGGADVETNEVARKRQPAKLRHGNRVHTLADIEDFALASGRDVAQARASGWRGGVRLIVALSGANPVPYPARIRALTRQLTGASGYGLSRPGGLTVIGPRLLKLCVNIILIPDDPDQSVSLAQKIRNDLAAFLDPASGGFNGAGWPLGRVPTLEDIAGALAAVADKAVIEKVELRKEDGDPMPDAVAPNVLVQLGDVTFDFRKADEVAA